MSAYDLQDPEPLLELMNVPPNALPHVKYLLYKKFGTPKQRQRLPKHPPWHVMVIELAARGAAKADR
jgi:hypothetical protein